MGCERHYTLKHRYRAALDSRLWAVATCVGVIFFSSTSVAGRWSDDAFNYLWVLLAEVASYAPPRGFIHLLAEKSVHVALFCFLGALLWKTVPNRARKIWVILLSGAVIGSCSEFLQSYFPGRDPLVRDVLLNIIGTSIGIAFSKKRAHLTEESRLRAAQNNL